MKVLILIIITFLLTGCSVDYKLNIDDEFNLEETVEVSASTNDEGIKIREYDNYLPVDKTADAYEVFVEKYDEIEYYNSIRGEDSITFDYELDTSNYFNSRFAGNAYENILITKADGVLTLSTTSEFLPFNTKLDLDEVRVTITSNYEFIKCNADVVGKHECTWIINKDNAYNKSILLRLDTNKMKGKLDNRTQILIIVGISIGVVLVVGFRLYKRIGMKNKI